MGGILFKDLISRLFGGPAPGASELRAIDPARWESSLLDRVNEMSADDPLIGAKIGGKELAERLMVAMEHDRGVHVESLLCAAGALAGYSCQAALRARNRAQGLNELARFQEAQTSDGQRFFFGDELNHLLAEGELSVWSLAAGGAQHCGCTKVPDIGAIFAHVAGTIGHENFGVPRLPPDHPVHELPRTYLDRLWPRFSPMIERFCSNPDHRPVLLGKAIQEILLQTKSAFEPCLALQIVMESAIPMSKVDMGAGQEPDVRQGSKRVSSKNDAGRSALSECPHCYTRVLVDAHGNCPSCGGKASGQAKASKSELAIHADEPLPALCFSCGEPTGALDLVRLRQQDHRDSAPSRFVAILMAVIGLFAGLRIFFSRTKRVHAVDLRIPHCDPCKRKDGPAKARHVDFDAHRLTFVVHKKFKTAALAGRRARRT